VPADPVANGEVQSAIAFIQKRGQDYGKRLLDALEEMQPSVIQLRSLVAKGQVFGFKDYTQCQSAVATLTWHFDRLEALTALICTPSLNWESPEVAAQLKEVMKIDPDEIRESCRTENVKIIEFFTARYKDLYG
ncbi:MAG TPA: hypothetical protein VMB48_16865, partial [Steroidobacteraceae bacterium]|nr:hypothetical protein [Steroidobacteraceae bacterium]